MTQTRLPPNDEGVPGPVEGKSTVFYSSGNVPRSQSTTESHLNLNVIRRFKGCVSFPPSLFRRWRVQDLNSDRTNKASKDLLCSISVKTAITPT